jgi:hypothetical protein
MNHFAMMNRAARAEPASRDLDFARAAPIPAGAAVRSSAPVSP